MVSISEKIADIEAEMARTQKNKATEYHVGLLRGKLARLRSQLVRGCMVYVTSQASNFVA